MGASSSKTLTSEAELSKNFIIDSQNKQQSLTYLTHKYNHDQYLLRESIFNDQSPYQELIKKLEDRTKIKSQNITQLQKFQHFKQQHVCSNDFRVYSLWHYPRKNLKQQIMNRALQKKPFSLIQINNLLCQIAQGLALYQQNKKSHECLTTQTILLAQDGSAKVVDVLCIPMRPNLQLVFNRRSVKRAYVSPSQCKIIESQQFTDYTQNPFKEDVFVVAMIIIQCALLQRQDDCYDNSFERVNWGKITHKLNLVQSKYGVQLRSVLQSMLKEQLGKRADWRELTSSLRAYKFGQKRQGQIPIINILQPIAKTYVQRFSQRVQSSTPIQSNLRNSFKFTYTSNKIERAPLIQQSIVRVEQVPMLLIPSRHLQQQGIQNYRPQNIVFNYDKVKYLMSKEGINAQSNTLQVSMSSKFTPIDLTNIKINEKNPASTNIPNQPKIKEDLTFHSPDVQNFSLHINEPIFTIDEYSQGKRYEGYKVNGKKQGEGKFYLDNKLCFFGNWKDDLMQGYGKLYYQSGTIAYKGNFSKDKFHGEGKLYNEHPLQLDATFNFNNFEDVQEYWSSYEGFFQNDKKQGKGQLWFTNGEHFEGNFHEDFVEGQGTYTKITGEKIRGIWHENKLVQRLD